MAFIILQLGFSQVLSFSCGRERERDSLKRGKICVLCFAFVFEF